MISAVYLLCCISSELCVQFMFVYLLIIVWPFEIFLVNSLVQVNYIL